MTTPVPTDKEAYPPEIIPTELMLVKVLSAVKVLAKSVLAILVLLVVPVIVDSNALLTPFTMLLLNVLLTVAAVMLVSPDPFPVMEPPRLVRKMLLNRPEALIRILLPLMVALGPRD